MIRLSRPAPLTLAMCLALPAAAQAQENSTRETEIIVTGTGLAEAPGAPAYDRQTIVADRLSSTASGRIEDALGSIAGFQQFRRSDSRSANPSAQGVTLRALGGNATSRSLVLLDGVPMADPFFGFIPLSAIAPERLALARVTRGGGSGAFGSGAVAGTIELESAGPRQLGLFSGETLIDDRGESTLSATLAPQLGAGFATASVRWDRGEGFWTTPPGQRVPASVRARYDGWSFALRGVAPLAHGIELQARGLVFDDNRTLRFAGANAASSGQDASLRLIGSGAWQFDALAYLQARDFSNTVISAASFRRVLDQRATPSTGWGGRLELRPPAGQSRVLRLGLDWRVASGTMAEDAYSGITGLVTARRKAGGQSSDLGLYAEHDWTLGAITLTAGLRTDRWSISDGFFREENAAGTVTISNSFAQRAGWEWSGRGGVLIRPGGDLTLRGSIYSGLRLPTLNELYRPFTVFPITTRANANLVNERLFGFEAGLDWQPAPALHISVTAFDNRAGNAVANVTIGTNLRERRNVDAVRARGLELGLGARLGPFSLDGSLALADARVEASGSSAALNGMRPAQTPQLAANTTLAWAPAPGWRLALSVRHIGMQYEDDLQTDQLPAATTLDLFTLVPISPRFGLVFRIENLTDAAVITRNQGGSIDQGAPRTVWAGLRISIGR
ncbi:MAG: TonB-dependent receptor [Novosphingobium sp.]|uniref:TonB-dependent receptor plug domain-containing protein n=1 Tax=Novosphingobium sp. TaxID=1874826 RepID=UPI0032BC6F0A